MPELPDVEGFRRYYARYAEGKQLKRLRVPTRCCCGTPRRRRPGERSAAGASAAPGRRRGGIKSALMDQRLIAGVGNLLSDEVLWRARIHPRRRANELRPKELSALDRELQRTIAASNRRGRIPGDPDWLTGVRDRRDGRCPRCGAPLARATVAGRTACWCPRCQRE